MIEIRYAKTVKGEEVLHKVVGHNVNVYLKQLNDIQWILALWEPSEKGPGCAPEGTLRVFLTTKRAHIKATVDDERERQ